MTKHASLQFYNRKNLLDGNDLTQCKLQEKGVYFQIANENEAGVSEWKNGIQELSGGQKTMVWWGALQYSSIYLGTWIG